MSELCVKYAPGGYILDDRGITGIISTVECSDGWNGGPEGVRYYVRFPSKGEVHVVYTEEELTKCQPRYPKYKAADIVWASVGGHFIRCAVMYPCRMDHKLGLLYRCKMLVKAEEVPPMFDPECRFVVPEDRLCLEVEEDCPEVERT